MYTYEERMKAVKLYIKYDRNMAVTIRELGYPSRQMLYQWYKELYETGALRDDGGRGHSLYSTEQRKKAVEYYLEHGRSISRTIKALGFPRRTTLREWIQADVPDCDKRCVASKTLVRYTEEQKEQAVIRFCSKEGSAKEIASEIGATESSVRRWRDELLHERCSAKAMSNQGQESNRAAGDSKQDKGGQNSRNLLIDESTSEFALVEEKQALTRQVKELKEEVHRLQLERDILEKAGELIKKGQGINPQSMTNQEKAVLIDALREKYRLKELLGRLQIAKSSYFYQKCALQAPDKYASLRTQVKGIFAGCHSCYGYRRIHAVLQRKGVRVSEKVIRRIMAEEQLSVFCAKKKKYSSYQGEISPEVENLVNRDFGADIPNEKWLTDITEFSIPAGKVYLSPIVDCFDGMAVSWTIGTSPDAELVNSMLDAAVSVLENGEHPIIHSDRGCHYRWPGWIQRTEESELTRSMSKKGCSPDNSACEGFFGRVKNEMFYGRSWVGISLDEFINTLDTYLKWYNESRIKMSLGAKSPLEYRQSFGLL